MTAAAVFIQPHRHWSSRKLADRLGVTDLLLTDDEGVAIAVGLRSQAAAGLRGSEHTTLRALAKLEQVLPPALRGRGPRWMPTFWPSWL
ncbi:hypothetical protein [Cryobacterium adonitolivorans]|uniref:hypothetical protein n=1 Tax=Cryobacterium adonitolivorans TaxID=1259189 RepID=UPI0018E0A4CA|nr:hypothetical protein [Cryobacterium adonitolivorans]